MLSGLIYLDPKRIIELWEVEIGCCEPELASRAWATRGTRLRYVRFGQKLRFPCYEVFPPQLEDHGFR